MARLKNRIRRQIWKLRNPGLRPPPALVRYEYPQYNIGVGTYSSQLQVHEYDSGRSLTIGNYCSIAAEVQIMLGGDHRFDFVSMYPFNQFLPEYKHINTSRSKGDVVIGSDVWIGRGAMIMPGVTIGHGAVIAARSLVTRDVAPYAIVGGSPAKQIKLRFSEEQIAALLAIAWWDWPEAVVHERVPELLDGDIDAFIAKHFPYR